MKLEINKSKQSGVWLKLPILIIIFLIPSLTLGNSSFVLWMKSETSELEPKWLKYDTLENLEACEKKRAEAFNINVKHNENMAKSNSHIKLTIDRESFKVVIDWNTPNAIIKQTISFHCLVESIDPSN